MCLFALPGFAGVSRYRVHSFFSIEGRAPGIASVGGGFRWTEGWSVFGSACMMRPNPFDDVIGCGI